MNESKFEEIWGEIAERWIVRISEKNPLARRKDNAKSLVLKEYKDINKRYHHLMLDKAANIDRHKVAACYVYAILKVSPIKCPKPGGVYDEKHLQKEYLLNEILSWAVAVSVLRSFMEERCVQSGDILFLEFIKANGFQYPKTEHDTYHEHMYKSLFNSRKTNQFDVFTFAHVLFLIESYTKEAYLYRQPVQLAKA